MKMFRMIVVRMGLLLLVFHSFYAISYASSDLTRAEKAYIEKKGQIVFVSQSQYAPFEFIQKDGNRDGMCIELARWIATEFGFKARFIDTSFATAQQMIQDGKADVLTSFFYSKKRDQLFDFSQTMFYIPATIFVAADRPDIKNMQDLNGKIIAIQKGDYAEDFLHEKQIDFTVLHANNFSEATDMVIQGKADAIIGDEQIVLYHLYSNNLEKKLKKVGKPLYTGENSMAVVEKNRVLTSILNKGIDLAQERGVLKTINEKWLGTKLQQQQNIYYPYRWHIGITSLSILCLLVAIWLWNLSLRREVRRRTMTLRENEHFLDTVIEHIPNMIFVKKAEDLTFLKFNRAGEKLTGYSLEKLYGKNDDDFFPKEQADFFTRKDRDVLNSRELVDIPEERIQTLHLGERKLHTKKIPILDENGEAKYLLGISEDITDRLAAEQNLVNALKEKETLLKEVHHRVKNNMQIISSLLSLQMQTIKGAELFNISNAASSRIRAMALIHENLYQSESFDNISAAGYLDRLTSQLSQLMENHLTAINYDIHIQGEEMTIPIDDASPFGLIVTEIITNAIKYAFPDQPTGTIKILLSRRDNGHYQLQVSDNGIGFASEFDPQKTTTLGMQLIKDLTESQLEGRWSVDGSNGVSWNITWS